MAKKYDPQYYRDRMAVLRRERASQGLKLVQVWVPARYENELKDYAQELIDRDRVLSSRSRVMTSMPPVPEPPRAPEKPTDIVAVTIVLMSSLDDEFEFELASMGFRPEERGMRWTHAGIQRQHAGRAREFVLDGDPSAEIEIDGERV